MKRLITLICVITMLTMFSGCTKQTQDIDGYTDTTPIVTVDVTGVVDELTETSSFSAGNDKTSATNTDTAAQVTGAAGSQSSEYKSTPKPSPQTDASAAPKTTSNSSETQRPQATQTPKPSSSPIKTPSPTQTTAPTVRPTATPTQTPTPTATVKPTDNSDEMKIAGDDYGRKVLEGVNAAREIFGSLPLTTYGGQGSLLERCIEMAKGGVLLPPTGSNESTSKSNDDGHTMGVMSATHAYGIGKGDYTTLYVVSIMYKGARWTIVRAE